MTGKKPPTNKGGISNLTPFSKDDNRASEAGKKGQPLAVESRRKTKTFKESLKHMLHAEMTPAQKRAYKKMGYVVDDKEISTHMDLAIARCLSKVISTGDHRAMKDIAEMAGEHTDKKEIKLTGDGGSLRPVINLHLGDKPGSADVKEEK